jgi:leader peptidase (prepilin peptidase) / N-methyltransferase
MNTLFIIYMIIIGACMGSFCGAYVYRIRKGIDWVKGRSICEHCKHQLKTKDLIPFFSWLSMRGKCRYCHKKIGNAAILLEICGGALFGFATYFWPSDLGTPLARILFVSWLIIVTAMIAMSYYDILWMEIPDKTLLPMLCLAIARVIVTALSSNDGAAVIKSALIAILIGGGLFYGLFALSNGRWIGGGDVKLGFMLGALIMKPFATIMMIFLSSLFGTVFMLPLMIKGQITNKTKIPFGPFLMFSAYFVSLFGVEIIEAYKKLVLL